VLIKYNTKINNLLLIYCYPYGEVQFIKKRFKFFLQNVKYMKYVHENGYLKKLLFKYYINSMKVLK
jgi:hypothetical protein